MAMISKQYKGREGRGHSSSQAEICRDEAGINGRQRGIGALHGRRMSRRVASERRRTCRGGGMRDGQTGGWWRLVERGPEESEGRRPRNWSKQSFEPGGRVQLSMKG